MAKIARSRKKQPHTLHHCSSVEQLLTELRSKEIDLLSLVYEFVRPSFDLGILVTGSIVEGVATELSDLDVLVLLPSSDAFKGRRKREVSGSAVHYLPTVWANTAELVLFLSGIEIDTFFMVNARIDHSDDSGTLRSMALKEENPSSKDTFLTRLATGWVIHGHEYVERWRAYYETDKLRRRLMAAEFTKAAKTLEDMEIGVGLAPGHVGGLGGSSVMHLLSALLVYNGTYCTIAKRMVKIDQLISAVDPAMQQALRVGRELAFPSLLKTETEERAYVDRVYEYFYTVKALLSRDEGMGDVLASIIHDLDIIL